MSAARSVPVARLLPVLLVVGLPAASQAQPIVRGADARVSFESPIACSVELATSIDAPARVEHRLDLGDGARLVLHGVDGAAIDGPPQPIGRTSALRLTSEGARYVVRYSVSGTREYRCPLWLPTVPASGGERAVRIAVRVPGGAVPQAAMPALTWNGEEGVTTLGHLPAFVHVPFARPGEPPPRDIARLMDVTSLTILAAATLAWAYRQRQRRRIEAA